MGNLDHIGFATTGWSFAKSAKALEIQIEENVLWLPHEMPVDYLFSHAIELMMKGLILKHDPNTRPQKYGHRLLDLYNKLNSQKETSLYIANIEKKIENHWKDLLRCARDIYEDALDLDWSDETRRKFGSLTNNQISESLPKLRNQIEWLSERHGRNGDIFRYYRQGLDQRRVIHRWGLNLDVVRETVFQACMIFHEQITGQKPH